MVLRTSWGLEYSFHGDSFDFLVSNTNTCAECPQKFREDLRLVFPNVDPAKVIIVPTRQKSQINLTDWGGDVENEKDQLLERFAFWAGELCQKLINKGYWADYIDPCSGLPMIDKKLTTPYGEVEGFSIVLGYEVTNAGCCKVLLHPEWGTNVYPATLFTTASKDVISQTIKENNLDNKPPM